MSQYGRPITDITNSGWTPIPVYAQIGEVSPDDADYVISSAEPGTSSFEVLLSELAQPDFGNHTLSVRLDKTDLGNLPVTIELLQGDSVIATRVVSTPALSFHTYDFALTDIEVGAITDYANLRLRVTVTSEWNSSSSSATSDQSGNSGGSAESSTASGQSDTSGGSEESSTTSGQSGTSGGLGSSSTQSSTSGDSTSSTTSTSQSNSSESSSSSSSSSAQSESSGSESGGISVACCPGRLFPSRLYATVTNLEFDCDCAEGTYPLDWDGVNWVSASGILCGYSQSKITAGCNETGWYVKAECPPLTQQQSDHNATCDPLSFSNQEFEMASCCIGGIHITVTE